VEGLLHALVNNSLSSKDKKVLFQAFLAEKNNLARILFIIEK
jgi:hypothetical protein